MDYRAEWDHDERFMALMRGLDRIGRLDILEQVLALPELGRLRDTRRRRAFDVEAQFEHRRLIVETKVDSDEGGQWTDDAVQAWQTHRIIAAANDGDVCLFVTYGYAEFFTKWVEPGPAAADLGFRHVRLDEMAALAAAAAPLLSEPAINEWLTALRLEQEQRRAMPDVPARYAAFRRSYLDVGKRVDFDVRRLGVNAAEMAFPAYDALRRAWDRSRHAARHGRLALYPVSRPYVTLPDSILNWWELWCDRDPLALGGVVPDRGQSLYLEANEDFNLHLKLGSADDETAKAVRAEVARRFDGLHFPGVIASRPEFHRQGAHAVWEWDLNLPALIARDGAAPAAEALGALLNVVVPSLM